MMRKLSLLLIAGLLLTLAGFLARPSTTAAYPVQGAGWGDIKGQVVWADKEIPQQVQPKLAGNDKDTCLAEAKKQGKEILSETFVVNPQNKGVKWVVVYLVDPKNVDAALPANPALPAPGKTVHMDQPCCFFEPHVLVMREGQVLEAKNTAPVAHNYKIDSPPGNPSLNQLVPSGKTLQVPDPNDSGAMTWKAKTAPSKVSCTIHPWMNGYVKVFNHPYYAVTDADGNFEIKGAPAGDYNIVMWQEETGFFLGNRDKKGVPVTIKANTTNDLGKFKCKPE